MCVGNLHDISKYHAGFSYVRYTTINVHSNITKGRRTMLIKCIAHHLIISRHVESVHNVAIKMAKKGEPTLLELLSASGIHNRDIPISQYTRENSPASMSGRDQAWHCGIWLKENYRIDRSYDSGYRRVRDGMEIMGIHDSNVDNRLTEYYFGDWSELSQSERIAKARSDSKYAEYVQNPYDTAPPGGKSLAHEYQNHVLPMLEYLMSVDAQTIFLATHGLKMQLFRQAIECQSIETFLRDNDNPNRRFKNGAFYICSRRSPCGTYVSPHLQYVRTVVPWNMKLSTKWQDLEQL